MTIHTRGFHHLEDKFPIIEGQVSKYPSKSSSDIEIVFPDAELIYQLPGAVLYYMDNKSAIGFEWSPPEDLQHRLLKDPFYLELKEDDRVNFKRVRVGYLSRNESSQLIDTLGTDSNLKEGRICPLVTEDRLVRADEEVINRILLITSYVENSFGKAFEPPQPRPDLAAKFTPREHVSLSELERAYKGGYLDSIIKTESDFDDVLSYLGEKNSKIDMADFLEKMGKHAVKKFFQDHPPGLGSYWKGKSYQAIKPQDMIEHAQGSHRNDFFAYTGRNTLKALTAYGLDVQNLKHVNQRQEQSNFIRKILFKGAELQKGLGIENKFS